MLNRIFSRLKSLGPSCLCALLVMALARAAPAGEPKYRIIGYVYGVENIHDMAAEKLTHINFAFALVSREGEVVLEDPKAPERLAQLQALKAKNPALKVIVSVGGWGADNFSD